MWFPHGWLCSQPRSSHAKLQNRTRRATLVWGVPGAGCWWECSQRWAGSIPDWWMGMVVAPRRWGRSCCQETCFFFLVSGCSEATPCRAGIVHLKEECTEIGQWRERVCVSVCVCVCVWMQHKRFLPMKPKTECRFFLSCFIEVSIYRKLHISRASQIGQLACQCRRHGRHEFDPWTGKIPWKRAWQSTPVFLPGKSHGQRNLVSYRP